jgi:hypothetical protein
MAQPVEQHFVHFFLLEELFDVHVLMLDLNHWFLYVYNNNRVAHSKLLIIAVPIIVLYLF